MKKILCLSLAFILSIVTAAYAVTYNITKLIPSGALMAAGTMTIPAMAKSSAYGMRAIGLALPGGALAKIATAAVSLGGGLALGYAVDKINDYYLSKGYRVGVDGTEYLGYGASITAVWLGSSYDTTYSSKPAHVIVLGYYPKIGGTEAVPQNAVLAAAKDLGLNWTGTNRNDGTPSRMLPDFVDTKNPIFEALYGCRWQYGLNAASTEYYFIYAGMHTAGAGGFTVQNTWRDALTSEITTLEGTMTTDLNNNVASAVAAAWQAIQAAAYGLANPGSPLGVSPGMTNIKTELDGAISAAQKTAIDGTNQTADEYAADTPGVATDNPPQSLTATDVQNAVIAALIAQGLSAAEIQTAVSAALVANSDLFSGGAGGAITAEQMQTIIDGLAAQGLSKTDVQEAVENALGGSEGVDTTGLSAEALPDAPTKSDFAGILTTFKNAILALPILSLLTDFEVEASGSSVITLNIPGFAGGSSQSATIDFSQWESIWLWMGQILLMVTGIRWTMYLFEG